MKRTKHSTVRLHESRPREPCGAFPGPRPEDRRLRFGVNLSDDSVRDYVARLDFRTRRLFGVHDDNLELVAVVHAAPGESGFGAGPVGAARLARPGRGQCALLARGDFLRKRGTQAVFVHCLAKTPRCCTSRARTACGWPTRVERPTPTSRCSPQACLSHSPFRYSPSGK